MKVAILTIHHVPNFGAVMQAYCLRSAINRMGHDCKVINYQPTCAIDFYRKARGRFPKSILRLIRHKIIQKFVNRQIVPGQQSIHSPQSVFAEAAKFDAVVCGSDQIWHASGFRGLDETFFLAADLPSTKKISYAPSIGSSNPSDYARKWQSCHQWLRDFDAVSVRDLPSQKMVENFGLKAPEVVCDPTLLPGAMNDLSFESGDEKKQLLIYGGRLERYHHEIRRLAEKFSLEIVSVGAKCGFEDKSYSFASPRQWAMLFGRARIVVTGMFHGVQLALLNNAVPLYIGPNEKKSKVMDVLNRYEIGRQWVESPNDVSVASMEIQFARLKSVEDLRNRIAQDSLSWLESQLR